MKENGKITTNEIFLLSSAVVNNNISTRKKDNKFDTTTNTLHLAQHRRSPFFSLTHSHSFFPSIKSESPSDIGSRTPLRHRYDFATTCRRRPADFDDDHDGAKSRTTTRRRRRRRRRRLQLSSSTLSTFDDHRRVEKRVKTEVPRTKRCCRYPDPKSTTGSPYPSFSLHHHHQTH